MLGDITTFDMYAVVEGPKKYIVNLNTRYVVVGDFTIHIMQFLDAEYLHESYFYSTFYGLKNFRDAYVIPVESIACESTWDIPGYISKPKLMASDPSKSVRKSHVERWKEFADVKFKRSKVTCSRCRQAGHNRKTCSNYPVKKWFHDFYFLLHNMFCFME